MECNANGVDSNPAALNNYVHGVEAHDELGVALDFSMLHHPVVV
jgi:hypothetical protein